MLSALAARKGALLKALSPHILYFGDLCSAAMAWENAFDLCSAALALFSFASPILWQQCCQVCGFSQFLPKEEL